jgi:eukaryotic-like serine/threonine-protein kinase
VIFGSLPVTESGYIGPVVDEAGRTGCPPMSDADDDVTCARFALGEFTIAPRQALDDERPPALLAGRYEVGKLIGSGGTARVHRAYDVRLAREVAVKIYDRDAVALDQRRRLRETTIQGSITHPGVVALLDSGTENGRTYLVMQLVEGQNLAERLLSGPMPVAEVTALADGLAGALAHVHSRRVVHRDLKPANVFLSAGGPLIGDFGIAHALDTTHITGTGLVPGTAAYLAPEQVGGEPTGPPADVYALGLMLLECLTGQREYPGTMVEAAMARLTRPPRIPDDLPASLAHLLRRMTQREPADRPTAVEVLRLLHDPAPTLPAASPERWRRGPARRRIAAAAGLTVAAVAAASAMLLAGRETGTSTPAQPPTANSPAATSAPSPSAPVVASESPAPRPHATGSASRESAAVPQESAVSATQPTKPGKPEKPEKTNGNGKGKGPGND